MTIKDYLNKKKTTGGYFFLSGFIPAFIIATFSHSLPNYIIFSLMGLCAIGGVIGIVIWFSIYCPECGYRFPYNNNGSPFTFSDDMQFCSGCGISLKNELRACDDVKK